MKKKLFNRALSGIMTAIIGFSVIPASKPITAKAAPLYENGTHKGLDWELWQENDTSNVEMKLNDNGGFTVDWSNNEMFHARTGKIWESDYPKLSELGDIRFHYAAEYESIDTTTYGAYGWTIDNNCYYEFNIIDNNVSYETEASYKNRCNYIGTTTVNDYIYDVYMYVHPIYNISSHDNYVTYTSLRRNTEKISSSVINVSEHFRQWEKLGLNIGTQLHDVTFCVFSCEPSGHAEVMFNYMTIDGEPVNTQPSIENNTPDVGTNEGLDWELWQENDITNVDMKLNDNGGFTVDWSNNEMFHARTGKIWESDYPKLSELGDIKMYYDVEYESDDTTTLGAYGFILDNSCNYEFSIIENNVTYTPIGKLVGTATVNGEIYDVYINELNTTSGERFVSYYSYRRTNNKATKGVIDVSKHFREWEKLGLKIGSELHDVTFCVSSNEPTGHVEVNCNYMTIGDKAINTGAKPDWIDDFASENVILGDINNDGEIDVFDIPLMRNTVLNSSAKSVTNTAADIDGDGNIAINDAVLLNQYIYGKISSFRAVTTADKAA